MIAIVDYGMGNIGSILNMFKRIEVKDVIVTGDAEKIRKADKIILPGVGSFDTGMIHLKENGLIEVLTEKALKQRVPVLGICLGMQLITKRSEEGVEPGLGWIDAETKRFQFDPSLKLKVPHMGWNYLTVKKENALIEADEKKRFYFVHSYYVKCNVESDILAESHYGFKFTCSLNRDNIFGAQFHPEKSHKFGMKLYKNFASL
ncbi:imidazole glycerol phosphate synthase subunit HisH [Fulvivirgaceae bacterium PWU4]|uniref:Imidazole glycerol phosphate synthase subunit HisH n=1 Tax=Chryseosolibacter histidini TaxID=2782349 RepID=A0AAP2GSA2_9BACT|nr:imidazole glycerol phosphate synthase subunit HisH [Chryseosolibacter histidini]MBT1700915.1 imidazole glycerol phosphate synthase subunit HisH [Chryseosolibacter histidini]